MLADARLLAPRLLAAGPVTLDRDSRMVHVHDTPVRLTPMEVAVLELMLLRRGAPQTRAAFMRHLYVGVSEPDGKIIDVFLCKLRKKLADAGAPGVVVTVSGQGYAVRGTDAMRWAQPCATYAGAVLGTA